MTWPEAFVAAIAIVAFVVLGIGFFWMLAHTEPVESRRDAILRRNAEMPMHWTFKTETRPAPEPRWVEKRKPVKQPPTPKATAKNANATRAPAGHHAGDRPTEGSKP